MPGKRRLAAELSVSVNTVDAAYQILATEGYMEPRERSGFYVQEYLALPTRPEEVPPPVSAAPPEAAEPPVRFDLSTLSLIHIFKRYLQRGNCVVLQPFNPAYKEMVIKGEELNHLHIAGRVVETKAKW